MEGFTTLLSGVGVALFFVILGLAAMVVLIGSLGLVIDELRGAITNRGSTRRSKPG